MLYQFGKSIKIKNFINKPSIFKCLVNVIIMDKAGRILLRYVAEDDKWALPGGVLKKGQLLEELAKAETFNQVGLRCRNLKIFSIYLNCNSYYENKVYDLEIVYVCKDISGQLVYDKAQGKVSLFFDIKGIPIKTSPLLRKIGEELSLRREEVMSW